MDYDSALKELYRGVVELKEVAALTKVAELLKRGHDPKAILDCLSEALLEIGRLYEAQEYYMTSLVVGGDLLRQALQLLMPHLIKDQGDTAEKGLVMIGTIEGDIHDLGKNMAGHFLRANGFKVIDLGVDVPPAAFLRESLRRNPDVIGVSLLLTTCVPALKKLAHLLAETYQGQPRVPALFAACGFLKRRQAGKDESRARNKEKFGVEQVFTEIAETVAFCRAAVAGL